MAPRPPAGSRHSCARVVADHDEYGVALRVATALESLDIDYTLGGSLASSLQGEPRSTNDVDFAVRLEEHHVSPLIERLGPDFVADAEDLRAAVRQRRSYQVFYLPLVLKIGLFVRGSVPFDDSEFARRIRVQVDERGSLFAATPEDSLLRKLVWFRQGGEVSDLQWRDVLGLIRAPSAGLDRAYLDRWGTELGVRDLLARAFDQAQAG
jgi:hypothetical protein